MTAASMKLKVNFRTCRRDGESDPAPEVTGPTQIARRIALAHHIEDLIERGELRDYAEAADRLGLTGWVRNGTDGQTVEVVVEGNEAALVELEAALQQGPPGAAVDSVESERTGEPQDFSNFTVQT